MRYWWQSESSGFESAKDDNTVQHNYAMYLLRKNAATSRGPVESIAVFELNLNRSMRPISLQCHVYHKTELSLDEIFKHVQEDPGLSKVEREAVASMRGWAVKTLENADIGLVTYEFIENPATRTKLANSPHSEKSRELGLEILSTMKETMKRYAAECAKLS